jgi:hypothetical protein
MSADLKLATPCGLFCGACTLYVARRRGDKKRLEQIAQNAAAHRSHSINLRSLDCEGCLSDVVAFFCRERKLRSCAYAKGLTHCSQCSDFPFQRIIDFNDDGRPHHGEVLKNIRRQQEISIESWITKQKEKWRCSRCDCVVD